MPPNRARRLVRTIPALALLLSQLACQTAYYSAWEQLGYEKRHIFRSRVEAARDEQQEAQEQFKTTYERFVEATGFDGGDLEDVYNRLNSDFEASEAKAEDVRDRIDSIESVATAMFSEWEGELALIGNAQMRSDSERSLRDTKTRYAKLIDAMRRAEAKMDPVLSAFRDQVLFLKHNLNARAIASLETQVESIEGDVSRLIREMQSSIEEADSFLANMDGSA